MIARTLAMRLTRGALAALVAVGFLGPACGGLRYPGCDEDGQCNLEGHTGVCVQHLCTQCRDDSVCQASEACKGGACVTRRDYCDSMHPCASGECGGDHRCTTGGTKTETIECGNDRGCLGGARCENGHCVDSKGGAD
jgi:hypothetical protein